MFEYLKYLIWIFAIPFIYGVLSFLGIFCFEISLILDKRNIEIRRENFNKGFLLFGWLIPFLFVQDLLRGKYKKRSEG